MEAVIVTVVENAELAALVASAVVGEVSRTGFKKIGILSLSSSHKAKGLGKAEISSRIREIFKS